MVSVVIKLLNSEKALWDSIPGDISSKKKLSFAKTQTATRLLRSIFESGPLGRFLPLSVIVLPRWKPYKVQGHKDKIITASSNGYNMQFYAPKIMSDTFERLPTHFGPSPRGVRHYTVMILHEYGHVIHRAIMRMNETNRNAVVRWYMGPFIKCWKALEKDFDEQSEWFADVFARVFVRAYDPTAFIKQEGHSPSGEGQSPSGEAQSPSGEGQSPSRE